MEKDNQPSLKSCWILGIYWWRWRTIDENKLKVIIFILGGITIALTVFFASQSTVPQHNCYIDYDKVDQLAMHPIPYIEDRMTVGQVRSSYVGFRSAGMIGNNSIFGSHLESYLDEIIICESEDNDWLLRESTHM